MAIITQSLGKSKGYRYCWVWGLFLGIIGIIIVACCSNKNETTSVNSNKYDNLEKLNELKNNGAISQEEYENEKNKLLK